ncbi:MAG: 2-(1,2-epoxy-1,2-dihydrophenyl)acetyl-CoA isomerase [Melioribacteraceae bacterium]|nr:MAG: 2-(1,2-epoxy-1,2-dihydrophenyl)acetyl-CoA isomerase [Melioribacteraceae bacterium]
MEYKNILTETVGGLFIITINRPDVLNSINSETGKELQHALGYCADTPGIRAVLLTGTGRAFCAGQDLAEALPKDNPPADIATIVRETYNPIILKLKNLSKPVIAGVNGVAAGAGANIALACDLIVASDKASFIQAFSKIGLIPDSGGTYTLLRHVGYHKAFSLMAFGEKLSSEEARNLGIVYRIFSFESFVEDVKKFAQQVASMPTLALSLTKEALNKSNNNDLEEQLELEEKLQAIAGNSYDYKEGVKAFLEKRNPEFKGE